MKSDDTTKQILTVKGIVEDTFAFLFFTPQKKMKEQFAAACLRAGLSQKEIDSGWVLFLRDFKSVKSNVLDTALGDLTLRSIIVQMTLVSSHVLANPDHDNDFVNSVQGAAVIFLSEWCAALGRFFFRKCPDQIAVIAFQSLWSMLLEQYHIAADFYGPTRQFLTTFSTNADSSSEDAPFSLVFPGPAPHLTSDGLSTTTWASYLLSDAFLTSDDQDSIEGFADLFGVDLTSRRERRSLSKFVRYINPTDPDLYEHRTTNKIMVANSIPESPEAIAFEQDDDGDDETDEDTAMTEEERVARDERYKKSVSTLLSFRKRTK